MPYEVRFLRDNNSDLKSANFVCRGNLISIPLNGGSASEDAKKISAITTAIYMSNIKRFSPGENMTTGILFYLSDVIYRRAGATDRIIIDEDEVNSLLRDAVSKMIDSYRMIVNRLGGYAFPVVNFFMRDDGMVGMRTVGVSGEEKIDPIGFKINDVSKCAGHVVSGFLYARGIEVDGTSLFLIAEEMGNLFKNIGEVWISEKSLFDVALTVVNEQHLIALISEAEEPTTKSLPPEKENAEQKESSLNKVAIERLLSTKTGIDGDSARQYYEGFPSGQDDMDMQ